MVESLTRQSRAAWAMAGGGGDHRERALLAGVDDVKSMVSRDFLPFPLVGLGREGIGRGLMAVRLGFLRDFLRRPSGIGNHSSLSGVLDFAV